MVPVTNFAFLLPVMMLTFGCTFLVVGRFGSREARHWGAGYLAAAAAFFMPLVPPLIPIPFLSLIADALFLAAFFFYGGALLSRFGQRPFLSLRLALALAMYAATVYAVLGLESIPAELLLSDAGCAVLLGFGLAVTARRVRHAADIALLSIAGLVILEIVLRNAVLIFIAPSYGGAEGFLGSDYHFFMQAGASVLALLFALAALGAATVDTIASYRDAAERDPMTGLLNRRGFARAAALMKSGTSGAIIIGDIDDFKRVNDTLGHSAGDAVICELAEAIKVRLPAGAFAARFGGEEFVIFLPSLPLVAAADFANRIRLGLANVDRTPIGLTGRITASFGVSGPMHGDHSLRDQIGRADIALYAAKEAGRNRVMIEGKPPREVPLLRVASTN